MQDEKWEHEQMPGIRLEVAIETLGQSKQPFIQATLQEEAKENPSKALLEYWRGRKALLTHLQRNLRISDEHAFALIAAKDKLI
jgi:hypothetical protein